MQPNRRAFILTLSSAGALVACSSGSRFLPNPAPDVVRPGTVKRLGTYTVPLRIVNNTGKYGDGKVWLYCYGLRDDNTWCRLVDSSGKLEPTKHSDDTSTYSLSLAKNPTLQIPLLRAGRVYIALGRKLDLQVGSNDIPIPPIGWNSADKNYDVPFDFVEFDNTAPYPDGAGFNCNTTQVQMYGLPMQLRVAGKDEQGKPVDSTVGIMEGGHQQIIGKLQLDDDFRPLIIPGVRVLAPDIGMEIGSGPNNTRLFTNLTYLDKYITRVWHRFETWTLVAETSAGKYVGQVRDGIFEFTTQPSQDIISFKKPTTKEVFAGYMLPMCGNRPGECTTNAALEIRGGLVASFTRTTLLLDQDLAIKTDSASCQNTAKFYKHPATDYYARFIHEYSIDGKAYAFGNDDVCSQSSFAAARVPSAVTVTLEPL
jgi:hypothetical protein